MHLYHLATSFKLLDQGRHWAICLATTHEQLFPFPGSCRIGDLPTVASAVQTISRMMQQFPLKRLQELFSSSDLRFVRLHCRAEGSQLEQHFGGSQLQSSEEVEMALREWL